MTETVATKPCHYCRQPIERGAKRCQHCHRGQPSAFVGLVLLGIILLFVLVVLL